MQRIKWILFQLLFIQLVFSQHIASDDSILVVINGNMITKSEFLYAYAKSVANNTANPKTVENFLTDYVSMKLKVEEAKELKFDTTLTFKDEFRKYSERLTEKYLTDNQIKDSITNLTYRRYLNDVNISHILVRIPENSTAEDTINALKKINSAFQRLKNEKFEDVALSVSEDNTVFENKGNIGWVSALRTSISFENPCFETPINKYSNPFRTYVGYHIVKVNDIRNSIGEVKLRHIMRSTMVDSTKTTAKSLIDSIYNELKNGSDFSTLAIKFSQETKTASAGGLTEWIKYGQMIPIFNDFAFDLKNIGDYSIPFQTPYGYHIIQLIDKHGPRPYKEIKEYLEKKINQTDRIEIINNSFLNKLKSKYHFRYYNSLLNEIGSLLDVKTKSDSILLHVIKSDKILFEFADQKYTQHDFVNYILNLDSKAVIDEKSSIEAKFQDFTKYILFKYEKSKLPEIYPQYRYQLNEYYDGMMLFEIEQLKGLVEKNNRQRIINYFNSNKSKYDWDEPHFKGTIFYCKDSEIYKMLKKLFKNNINNETVGVCLNRFNSKDNQVLQVESGVFTKGMNAAVDQYIFKDKKVKINNSNAIFPYIFVKGEVLNRIPSDYELIKSIVFDDYLKDFEQKWIDNLKKKYNVILNTQLLHKIEIFNTQD
jgi:peptidyl-prolyl cis-trans isomerase SurA